MEAGDSSRMLVWAGSGVGLMKEIVPAQVCPESNKRLSTSSLNRKLSNDSRTNVYYVYDKLDH